MNPKLFLFLLKEDALIPFLTNCKNMRSGEMAYLESYAFDCSAISCAFNWIESPEGYRYWNKLHHKLNELE